jgi:hypothetical protein
MAVAPVSGRSSTTTNNAAAAEAAAAEAARRAAEEARRAAEAARRAAEEARKAAEAAKKAAEAAQKEAQAAQAAAAKKNPNPAEQKKSDEAAKAAAQKAADATKADKAAQEKLQKAEEQVAITAQKATVAMERANQIAQKKGLQPAFSKNEVKATAPTKAEFASAFEGTTRKADLERLTGTKAPSSSEIAATLKADTQYATLASNPEQRAALDKLGIRNGQDLIRLGDRLEGQSQTGSAPGQGGPDLTQVKDPKVLEKILTAAAETRKSEDLKKVMADPHFAKELSAGKPPKEAKENTEIKQALQLSEEEMTNLTRNQNARNAARTLTQGLIGQDPKPNAFQMGNAVLTLVGQHSNVIRPERLREMLGSDKVNKYFGQIPNGNSFLGAAGAMLNPSASPEAKAKAVLGAVNGLKGMAGANDRLSGLADEFRKTDGTFRAMGNALTLLDPNAKPQDQALAAVQLAADIPGLVRDGKEFIQLLRENGVKDPEGLMKKSIDLENRTIAQLPPEVKDKLGAPGSPDRARRLAALTELEARGIPVKDLGPALTKLSTPDALDNAVSQIKNGTTPEQAKKYFATIGALDPKVATEALEDPRVAERLKNLSDKLPLDLQTDQLKGVLGAVRSKEGLDALTSKLDDVAKTDPKQASRLAKVLKGMDPQQLDKVLRNVDGAGQALDDLAKMAGKLDDAGVDNLAKVVKNMDPGSLKAFTSMAGKVPQDLLDKSLKLLTPVLEKTDSRIIGLAFKALDTVLGKMGVPLTTEAAEKIFKGLSKMIPAVGAIPGAVDTVKLGKEAAELHGQNKDLGYLALVGSKLNAIDTVGGIVLSATGVGAAVDLGVGAAFGIAELALDLGLHHEKAKMTEAKQKGEEYEAPGWVKAVNLFAAAATSPAGAIDYVAYMGPKKAFEDAKWALEQGGKLADKAWEVIKAAGGKLAEFAGEAVEALKNAGEWGVARLEELAGGVGDLAKAAQEKAQEALKAVARLPGEAAKKAAEAINRALDAGAEWAKAAATELLKDGVGAMKDVAKLWANGMSAGAKAVVDNLENLGEEAVDTLKDLSSAGGAVAEYTVGKLKNLAEDGVEAAKDALGTLADLGGKAGELAGDALDGLGNLARKLDPTGILG